MRVTRRGSPDDVTLTILVVNWNSRELLRRCLLSIGATCADLQPQVVVVDGGSFDGCDEMLALDFPAVDFVQSTDNLGFGRSNNMGLSLVTGDALLLLNPDTEIRPGAIQTLLRELRSRPDAGIVSPRLLNSDYSLQASVHALPRPVFQAIDSELIRRLMFPLGRWAPPNDFAPSTTVRVGAVAGACMLLWSETFRAVGGFSPHYFMYAEDMDLCLKVQQRGLAIYHVPHAAVLHHSGASSSAQGSTFSDVMIREALHTYFRLNRGAASAAVYRCCAGGWAVVRLMMSVPGVLIAGGAQRTRRRAAFGKWRSILSWSVGLERWTKRYAVGASPGPHERCGGAVAALPAHSGGRPERAAALQGDGANV